MKSLILSLIAIVAFYCPVFARKTTGKYVIKNVNLISADPAKPMLQAAQDVFISGGIIKKISSSPGNYKGYEIIDATGKYLIPGMADMHAHLPREKSTIQNRKYHLLNLLNGVTTVRQMRGKTADLAVRDSIQKGWMTGCNMYISSPPFFWDKNFSETLCRDSFLSFKKQGYDFIKYVGGLPVQQFDTFASVAASVNMKLTGHAPANDLARAVDYNMHSIEHISPYVSLYQKDSTLFWNTIDKIASKGLYYCPNFRYYSIEGSHTPIDIKKKIDGLSYLPDTIIAQMEKEHRDYIVNTSTLKPVTLAKYIISDSTAVAIAQKLLPAMYARGIKIVVSPASGEFFVPGFSFIEEMEILVSSGLTPYEALKCATSVSAECLGASSKWGTISENKQANLVLLSSNPLDNISNLKKTEATIINGKYLNRDFILNELKKLN
jgi:imidazolonepropionase-like amidohydrolase